MLSEQLTADLELKRDTSKLNIEMLELSNAGGDQRHVTNYEWSSQRDPREIISELNNTSLEYGFSNLWISIEESDRRGTLRRCVSGGKQEEGNVPLKNGSTVS